MRFWGREIGGWILLVLGLYTFYVCFEFLILRGHIVEAGAVTVMGIFIFRGGIHLLKVAVAARVCLEARDLMQSTTADRRSPALARSVRLPAGDIRPTP